jgi:ABC-type Zn2+ transport system substrate-binding protein/surface adhesin
MLRRIQHELGEELAPSYRWLYKHREELKDNAQQIQENLEENKKKLEELAEKVGDKNHYEVNEKNEYVFYYKDQE